MSLGWLDLYGVNNGELRPIVVDREYGVGKSILNDVKCN